MPSPSQIAVRRIISPTPKPKAEEEEIVKQRTSSSKARKETSSESQVQLAPRAVNVKIHIDEHRNYFNIYIMIYLHLTRFMSLFSEFKKKLNFLINY